MAKNINFKDLGMYLTFIVTLPDNHDETEIDCSQEIKKVEDVVRFVELYKNQDYKTLFKGHLEDYEINEIEAVEMGSIIHLGKNEKGDSIRVTSCGVKHQAFISVK